MLEKENLDRFRAILERQLQELKNDFGKSLQSMETANNFADINDQATLESERSFELRIRDRERKLISKVREALKKVNEGSYGVCESCGEMIGLRRLEARPVTSYCINCKAEMEAEERREENILQSESGQMA